MPITVDLEEIFGDLITDRVNRSAQAALEKGMREGIEKGREEGREQGALSLLRKQIINRFGPIPEWAEERLRSLSTGQLEDVSIRVLNVTNLDQLFAQQ